MGIGVSLILIAVGAILTWAVNATVSGLDINTVGVILMVVGAGRPRPLADLLVELGRRRRPCTRRRTTVRRRRAPRPVTRPAQRAGTSCGEGGPRPSSPV